MKSNKDVKANEDLNLLVNNLIQYGPKIVHNRPLIKMALAMGENYLIRDAKERKKNDPATLPGIVDDQTDMGLAILHSVNRVLMDRMLSDATYEKAAHVLGKDLLVQKTERNEKAQKFIKEHGIAQPSFLVISPSKACNLRCKGCYADSDAQVQTLDYEIVDRVVREARELWGIQFIVISGGEPLAYRSQGKTLLDLAEAHPDEYFMFYTNSLLISDEIARRMANMGNLIPMISLEGWKERTDERRGAGVFDQVMQSMDRLYSAGVLYGVSLTATNQNAEEILSDDFIDFLVEKKHAAMGWVFQYMPIGRSFTLDLMPTPAQRLKMWKQTWHLVRDRHIFLADFWNHGTVVDGCLSAGGHGKGGYMYLDWNGNFSPCVFVPYSPVNVKDLFARGCDLMDMYNEPFFVEIRDWQTRINVQTQGKNMLNPCPMRDHNAVMRQFVRKHEVEPLDHNAAEALQDASYAEGMDIYDARWQKIVDGLWEKKYMRSEAVNEADILQLIQSAEEHLPEPAPTGR